MSVAHVVAGVKFDGLDSGSDGFIGFRCRSGLVGVSTESSASGVIRFQFDCRGVVGDGLGVVAGVDR